MNQAHAPIAHKTICAAMADHRPHISRERQQIEQLLRTTNRGLTPDEIKEQTGCSMQAVTNAMTRIRGAAADGRRGYNLLTEPFGRQRKYRILPDATEPKPAPRLIRHTPEGLTPHMLAMPDFNYDPTTFPWPHLAPPARSDALAHSLCPSRDGDKFTPHTAPKAMCTGPGRGIYGPGLGIYGPGRINARSAAV